MAYQAIFKRYELKYMLTLEEKEYVLQTIAPYMAMDRYGRTCIRNVYFDTHHFQLIRHSIEKPLYKEKLRLRSYCQVDGAAPVFVELKKKYKGVVYKRRLELPEAYASAWLTGVTTGPDTQIGREIDYFRRFYQTLAPRVFLSYDREAYFCPQGTDLRITFDDHICARQEGLSLSLPPGGTELLASQYCLMEIKTGGAIPLWLTQALTRRQIFKTSFSKYGTAYQKTVFPNLKGGYLYV